VTGRIACWFPAACGSGSRPAFAVAQEYAGVGADEEFPLGVTRALEDYPQSSIHQRRRQNRISAKHQRGVRTSTPLLPMPLLVTASPWSCAAHTASQLASCLCISHELTTTTATTTSGLAKPTSVSAATTPHEVQAPSHLRFTTLDPIHRTRLDHDVIALSQLAARAISLASSRLL
jgi:hypothetical protein